MYLEKINKKVEDILKRLNKDGWEAFMVGGAARDLLTGSIPCDYDIATNATYSSIKKIFKDKNVAIVGASFKVCLIDGIEVATYRKYHNDKLSKKFQKAKSIHQDLARRDLTINSIAYSPINNKIIDDFGGISDYKNKIIKFTQNPEDRILEDPLRIIRACRFCSKINGTFDSNTFQSLKKYSYLIKTHVAKERIRLEIVKAMQYKKPSIFFDALYQINALEYIFPELCSCYGLDGSRYHGETVFEHSMIVGDLLPAKKPLLRIAGFLHDIGKPLTYEKNIDNKISFLDHENIGADICKKDLEKLKFSQKEIDYISVYVKYHMLNLIEATNPKTIRKILRIFNENNIIAKDWLRLKIADIKGNKKQKITPTQIKSVVLKIYAELKPSKAKRAFCIKDLAITGDDIKDILNIKQGPEVGKVLNKLLDKVIDDPSLNTNEKLIALLKR